MQKHRAVYFSSAFFDTLRILWPCSRLLSGKRGKKKTIQLLLYKWLVNKWSEWLIIRSQTNKIKKGILAKYVRKRQKEKTSIRVRERKRKMFEKRVVRYWNGLKKSVAVSALGLHLEPFWRSTSGLSPTSSPCPRSSCKSPTAHESLCSFASSTTWKRSTSPCLTLADYEAVSK